MRCKAGFFSGFISDSPIIGISGLVAYFKASDGVTKDGSNRVSQWNDQSGNGNHATASGDARPLYLASSVGGKPALDFDGTDQILTVPSDASIELSTLSLLVVYARNSTSVSDPWDGNDFVVFKNDVWGISVNDGQGGAGNAARNRVLVYPAGTASFSTGNTNPHLLGLTIGDNGTDVYFDGAVESADAATTASAGEGPLQIGGYDQSFDGSEKAHAKIAEVMLFNRVLTAGEIDTIEAYVSGRYGISIA